MNSGVCVCVCVCVCMCVNVVREAKVIMMRACCSPVTSPPGTNIFLPTNIFASKQFLQRNYLGWMNEEWSSPPPQPEVLGTILLTGNFRFFQKKILKRPNFLKNSLKSNVSIFKILFDGQGVWPFHCCNGKNKTHCNGLTVLNLHILKFALKCSKKREK